MQFSCDRANDINPSQETGRRTTKVWEISAGSKHLKSFQQPICQNNESLLKVAELQTLSKIVASSD